MQSTSWLRKLLGALTFGLAALVSNTAISAEPSPLTPYFTECHHSSPVSVCRYQSLGAPAMLKITYTGRLTQVGVSQVSAWVKLNGRTGIFRMEQKGNSETLQITNGATQCSECRDDIYFAAFVTCPTRAMASKWLCTESPKEAKDMFFWAVTDAGSLNAWDIDIAFVSGDEWDSQFGQNYRFRME